MGTMRWRWGVLAVAWAACLGACALVSGLSSLDVGTVDASVPSDGTVDAKPETSLVDRGAAEVVVIDAGDPKALHCGPDASCAFEKQTCCAKGSTYSCVDKGACTGDGASPIPCDFTGHCGTIGSICCLQAGGNQSITISCRAPAECKGASFNVQLCRSDSECLDGGKCTNVPTASWLSYCN